jgi:hypothetical protein
MWERVVDLAEGRSDADAERHVASCASCASKLESLREIMRLGDLRFFDAPAALVDSVKGMMPAPRRLPLMRSTLAWSGARAVAEDFQLVVGEGEEQIRLMYAHAGDGWEVMGRLPATDWEIARDGETIALDSDGRFTFTAKNLAETDFTLTGPAGELYVPAAEELLSREPNERG